MIRPACLAPCLATGLLLAAALPTPPASAQQQPWIGDSVLNDPEWQKRFLGSYGFLSGAEPKTPESELALLREVIELMKANPQAAATMLQQRAVEGGTSASLDFLLANLEFQNGNLDRAVTFYQSAIQKFPDFRRAHKNLGLVMVQKGDIQGSLGHLSKAIELGDRDGRTYGLLGYGYIQQEKYLAAEQAYRNAILQQPEVEDWKLGLARSLLATEHYRDAVSLFESLIAENPDDPNLWLLQANAYLGLEEPLEAAVNLEAVRMMGQAQSSSLQLLGDIYMNNGMQEFAKLAYLDVIASDQGASQFSTAYRAADLLVRTRSWREAAEILDAIDKRYAPALGKSDELKVLTLRAKVARAEGRSEEAAGVLESIVQRDGTRGDALLELASYYDEQGQQEKALLMIERAQNLEAFERKALLAHAQIRVRRKEYPAAVDLLRRALQIQDEPRVQRFLARVEEAARR